MKLLAVGYFSFQIFGLWGFIPLILFALFSPNAADVSPF